MQNKPPDAACPFCVSTRWAKVFTYTAPPEGEVRFEFSKAAAYYREVWRCETCGHFVSVHDMPEGSLYEGDYVNANYRDRDGLRRSFERIINLDPSRSDNVGRVQRVVEFTRANLNVRDRRPTVLDIGSGLCVFLHRMKAHGWDGFSLDPDERAAAHAREAAGVQAICKDFMVTGELGRYDLVTFNKVLEHVKDPAAMLARARCCVHGHGFVYVELPDGEAAADDGPGREEFFIDHHHVFSPASVALLARHAGFCVRRLERIREPSTKYTLFAFLAPVAG